MACTIKLNGKPLEVDEGTTLSALLDASGVNPKRVAVELNRRILARDEFGSTRLQAGDQIEVVTFVGGG